MIFEKLYNMVFETPQNIEPFDGEEIRFMSDKSQNSNMYKKAKFDGKKVGEFSEHGLLYHVYKNTGDNYFVINEENKAVACIFTLSRVDFVNKIISKNKEVLFISAVVGNKLYKGVAYSAIINYVLNTEKYIVCDGRQTPNGKELYKKLITYCMNNGGYGCAVLNIENMKVLEPYTMADVDKCYGVLEGYRKFRIVLKKHKPKNFIDIIKGLFIKKDANPASKIKDVLDIGTYENEVVK